MNIKGLIEELNINCGSVISVVGCGGKTTLITEIARHLSETMRVGIAASTKMMIPARGTFTDIFVRNIRECTEPVEKPGIYYFADEIVPGKLHGFSSYMLLQAKGYMDVLLIEADGSKKLPVKGWSEFEPVIVEDTTMTIGVMNLSQIGMPATEKNVHRLDEFEVLTGLKRGMLIENRHMAAMVNSKLGMFKNSKSKKVLLINQADEEDQLKAARYFCSDQPLKVDEIYYGSLYQDDIHHFVRERHKKTGAIVMASGFSNRMGENKLMIRIDGLTMIDRVLNQLDFVDVYQRLVVTAYEDVAACARKHSCVEVIKNEHPELGQSQSVKQGVLNSKPDVDGFMFLTGDMPHLSENTIQLLLYTFEHHHKIIVPVYGEERGNPVIFPAAYRDELLKLEGDQGGRAVIRAHESDVMEVIIDDPNEGMDIDTKEDLDNYKNLKKKGL